MYGRPEREKTRVARGSDFSPVTRGTAYASFSCQFVHIFEIKLFCFIAAMSELVHDVEAIHDLC